MSNLANEPQNNPQRGTRWHLKWLFACYAASFALFMLIAIASLPFVGFQFFELFFEPIGRIAQLVLAIALAPFIYRRLR